MIDATVAPEPPVPAKASRVWRIVLTIVAVQAVIVALGVIAFSALGLANDGTGSCGGG